MDIGTGGMLTIDGHRSSGPDIRQQNVTAALSISNIVKSSLGPVGLDKLLVDQVGDVTITNDGATILKLIDVEHPAGKVLCDLAGLQDAEVGDGTTSVVILAAELLKFGNELTKQKLHPTSVILGYKTALKEAVKFLKANLTIRLSEEDSKRVEQLVENAAETSMSSKIIGLTPNNENENGTTASHFAKLAAQAVLKVKTKKPNGSIIYPLKAINILKTSGAGMQDSCLVDGYAVPLSRASQGIPPAVSNAKIALLDFGLARFKVKMGITVSLSSVEEVSGLQQREIELTRERVDRLLDTGANAVFLSGGVDDLVLKFFEQKNIFVVRRVSPTDLRRLSKATGATVLGSVATLDSDEELSEDMLGTAAEVVEERVGDSEIVFVKGCTKTQAQTILLRGANEFMLDEVDRSLHDAMSVVKRCLENKTLVAGGGCVESALSLHLASFATKFESKLQMAILAFAEALLVIPKTLSVNAAKDATQLVADLKAKQYDSQGHWGLDLVKGEVRDNLEAGVLEPAISKVKSLRFATEAAVTILRIDDMIKLNPEQNPQKP
eukprot:maker-scaffold_7-snap-gene-3.56-mRNA-1 protein AED:0.04 eAED:0.04 QI:420/1/1/1/1/1/7/59/552